MARGHIDCPRRGVEQHPITSCNRRRHGIQRWPRRQLVKLSKALDEHISEQQGKGEDAAGGSQLFLLVPTLLLHTMSCRNRGG